MCVRVRACVPFSLLNFKSGAEVTFYEISDECYAIRGHASDLLLFPVVGKNDMADARTYEV